MDDIIREFLVESHENLDQLDRDLVALEKDPSSTEILSSIFRTIHTIKGTAGFLALSKLEFVTHAGESLLSLLRDGKIQLDTEITSGLLSLVDAVREMLAGIEATGKEGERDDSVLVDTLNRLQKGGKDGATVEGESPPDRIGDILVEEGHAEAEDVERAVEQQDSGDPRRLGEIMVEHGSVKPGEVAESLQTQGESHTSGIADSTIRVEVGLLDKLMNLVGELVLTRNQVLQYTVSQEDATFLATSQRLNLITTELQEGVMKTRMQPIHNIWSKFPRVVRDLAKGNGKQVRLEMEGKETEIDKTIIEAIKDPLMHLVRNCVDHGIESAQARADCGKSVEGLLLLRAFHEGGQVNIEISDDGAGMDPGRLKEKALERGMITQEQAGRMNEREIVNLVFLPGFSTAEKVTNVSGRGVGMDVVKTNIEKIGGTVDVQSQKGQGTTFKIKIPLTLAIIPALIVSCGGDRYAIPQVSLLELVRLEGGEGQRGIEMIHGAPVYRLRGNLLPLVQLNSELGIEDKNSVDVKSEGTERHAVNIVVLQAADRQFGLVVNEINDTEEIVVKPLGNQLKGVSTFAGATIMGDGSVALILDVMGIAQRASVVSEERDRARADKAEQAQNLASESQSFMVFAVGENGRVAMPLSMVARLEEFERNAIERAGNQDVVQYRSQIMPLINLNQVLDYGTSQSNDEDGSLQVIVYSEEGRYVGLVVDRILDIVDETLAVEKDAKRGGILGSAVINQHVTDLLDVHGIISSADPTFFEQPAAA